MSSLLLDILNSVENGEIDLFLLKEKLTSYKALLNSYLESEIEDSGKEGREFVWRDSFNPYQMPRNNKNKKTCID